MTGASAGPQRIAAGGCPNRGSGPRSPVTTRFGGATNITATLRRVARNPTRAAALIGC